MATKTTAAPQKAAPAKVAPKATAAAPAKATPAKTAAKPAAEPAKTPAVKTTEGVAIKSSTKVKTAPAATNKAPAKAKAAPATEAPAGDDDAEGDDGAVEAGTTVGRKEIAESVRSNLAVAGFAVSPKLAVALVSALETAVQTHVAAGESVVLPGFGKFKVSLRAGGERRNPRSGEMVTVPSAWVPSFKVGKTLKEAAQSRPVPTE